MLNKEQLAILNDIFLEKIVPVFEKEEIYVQEFMQKVDEHEKWIQNQALDKINLLLLENFTSSYDPNKTFNTYVELKYGTMSSTIKKDIQSEHVITNKFVENITIKAVKVDTIIQDSINQNNQAA